MPRNGLEWPSSWVFRKDENITNVERIKLTSEEQRELGCTVGECVFLEYPWAYVTVGSARKLVERAGSSLEAHRDLIKAYEAQEFLVGYASDELTSSDFVICLTEAARDEIRSRNRRVTSRVLAKVENMVRKEPRNWRSLKSEEELEQTFVKPTRPFYELEISLPSTRLGRQRSLTDRDTDQARDAYVEILPGERVFRTVPMATISRSVQTNLEGKEISVQSHFGYPKNKWTQYDQLTFQDPDKTEEPKDLEGVAEAEEPENDEETDTKKDTTVADESIDREPTGPTPLEIFLNARSPEVIDVVEFNTAINMHSDDIDNLAGKCFSDPEHEPGLDYEDRGSFVCLSITNGKSISDLTWHPFRSGFFAACYVNVVSDAPINGKTCLDRSSVLVWSISDSLGPRLVLEDAQEIHSVSFCPYRRDILIGGSASGQVVIWDLRGNFDDKTVKNREDRGGRDAVGSVSTCSMDQCHLAPIRAIRWLPPDVRIESSGKVSELSDKTSVQFMTASEDGSVAVWDLLWQPNLVASGKSLKEIVTATMVFGEDLKRLDRVFEPHFKLFVKSPKEAIKLTLLDLCLPNFRFTGSARSREISLEEKPDANKRLWLGLAQGQVVLCTWQGQDFETEPAGCESCEIVEESYVHDGAVIRVSRCPQIENLLLSIGGHVFAMWKDDELRSPLLWRRRPGCAYTACCWSHELPGVFVLGRSNGDLETWDISRKTKEPVHLRIISGNLITGLFPVVQSENGEAVRLVGVGEANGTFRIYEETSKCSEDTRQIRTEWFRQFVRKETERKRLFNEWQQRHLKTDEKALARRAGRVTEEAKRRHEEARLKFVEEQEELARVKAERRARRIPKSKETLRKMNNLQVAKTILLEKKGFSPKQLQAARQPLLQQQAEQLSRFIKAQKVISERDTPFNDALCLELTSDLAHQDTQAFIKSSEPQEQASETTRNEDFIKYTAIRDECRLILANSPQFPRFDWNSVMKEGLRKIKHSFPLHYPGNPSRHE
ncbi:dynein axonemal intermediate chain 3-like [Venturia canescens]|uniref:dynein axonemal intermediate chain 3-like n=1 Tax=Venturia canescens TaxID=32260 RepID=UPI001C9D26CA|nr:dynein axonemal intermediate chain 3-like [Venturia canescens]